MATPNAGATQLQTMPQTTQVTYNIPPNPEERPCMQRYAPCSIFVGMLAFMIIFTGIINIGVGANTGKGLSDRFYDSFPELRNSGNDQMYAGIALLIIGLCLLGFAIYWCRYVKRNFPSQSLFSRTQMTSGVVVASSSGVVQPPNVQGAPGQQTFVYSYQATQQPETVQQVQPGINQYPTVQPGTAPYPPAQPGLNQYPPAQPGVVQSGVQPSAPVEPIPDQPPPTYNELMEPTKDPETMKSYGAV